MIQLASCVVSGFLTILFHVHILSTCDLTLVPSRCPPTLPHSLSPFLSKSHLLHNLGRMMSYEEQGLAYCCTRDRANCSVYTSRCAGNPRYTCRLHCSVVGNSFISTNGILVEHHHGHEKAVISLS